MRFNKVYEDKLISFAVMIQSLLAVLQAVMIDVWGMNADATTIYRVLLTAFPMSVAIIIAFRRNGFRFLLVYGVIVLLFSLTIVIFPSNAPYLVSQGFRFFLPVVVPSALCLSVVHDIDTVEVVLRKISWFTSILVAYYFIQFFRGAFVIDGYNMVFSYACLLPMVTLYSQKKVFPICVSLMMFLAVIAIGSRGAALYFLIYVFVDAIYKNRKIIPLLLLLFIVFFVILPYLQEWLTAVGINSRSLSMLFSGNFTSESGRDIMRLKYWERLYDHPILGLGLYGDRVGGIGVYCHNFFFEILLDFGLLIGPFIIIFLVVRFVSIYKNVNKNDRLLLVRYLCALLLPLMTSDSYLITSSLAIFIGICYLVKKRNNIFIINN